MRGRVFFKMTGSGNDFVFVDGRRDPASLWSEEQIRAVCARQTGVGADGLAIVEPGSSAGAVRFHFYNNDGSRAPMCGNGALCATRLAAWLELAPAGGMSLETDAGVFATRCVPGSTDRSAIRLADLTDMDRPSIELAAGERLIGSATVGVPHLVVLVEDVESVDLLERGRALRGHQALGADGANVNFVARDRAGWTMRTYERGVEGETLACGTGAVAIAGILGAEGLLEFPWQVRTRTSELLGVSGRFDTDGDVRVLRDAWLEGQGRLVFRGVL